jgi:hypothetical protein
MSRKKKKGIYTQYDGLTQPLRNGPDYGGGEGSSVGDRLDMINEKMDKRKKKMGNLGIAKELIKLATEFGEAESGSLLSQLDELHGIDTQKHKSATEETEMDERRRRRTQMSSEDKEQRQLLAAIRSLKEKLSADDDLDRDFTASADSDLESWADQLADAERAIAEESTGYHTDDEGNQNDKSMKNWPITARQKMASRLVKLAKSILEDMED